MWRTLVFETTTYKPAVIVANKLDLKGAPSKSDVF